MHKIRRIRKSDCEQNFEASNREFDQDQNGNKLGLAFYYERDQSKQYESYVLEDTGKILGILCVKRQKDSLYISRLGIHKGHWRKGYGTELLKFAILKAIAHKTYKIGLETETENVEFYKNLGFKITRRYFDPHWGDSASMELSLRT